MSSISPLASQRARLVFCIRFEHIGAAEQLLSESFGIGGFVQLMAL